MPSSYFSIYYSLAYIHCHVRHYARDECINNFYKKFLVYNVTCFTYFTLNYVRVCAIIASLLH